MNKISNLKSQISNLQKGFTLIEVLVASTIFMFVAVMAIGIFVQSNRLTDRTDTDREVQQASRFVLEQVARSIRQARAVSIQATTSCPANFTVAKSFIVGLGTPERRCGEQFSLTLPSGTETYGTLLLGNYRCLARVNGSSLTGASPQACLTSPEVTLVSPDPADPLQANGLLVSGYSRPASELSQKTYVKLRLSLRATAVSSGGRPAQLQSFETTLVARNVEKQY